MKYAICLALSYIACWRRNPPVVGGKFMTGYGRVNAWASGGEGDLRRDICRCAASGVAIYHIELAGWAGSSVFTDPSLLGRLEDRYTFALRLCRAFGMHLFVSILNGNQGQGKYGDRSPTIERGWEMALRLLRIVSQHGKDNVLAQPVGETQDDGGRRFEATAAAELHAHNIATVNNRDSRPNGPAGMKHFAWHPFRVADIAKAPRDAIIVSDTGSIVQELGEGLDGPGRPDRLRGYVAACKARGCPAAVYYAFLRGRHDTDAIKALGAAIK
jgi:hypothetical protein